MAALGPQGPAHLTEILSQDMQANMGQLGVNTVQQVTQLVPW